MFELQFVVFVELEFVSCLNLSLFCVFELEGVELFKLKNQVSVELEFLCLLNFSLWSLFNLRL